MRIYKQISLGMLFLLLVMQTYAQENMSMSNPTLDPSPFGTIENNGSGCVSFTLVNVSLPGYDSAYTEVRVDLAKIAPQNGIESISSSFGELTKYEWEYDVDSNSFRGTQIDVIGALYSEAITICCDVIENSSCDSLESVGFAAEVFVMQGSDGNTNDNFTSGYTCTLETVSAVDNSKHLDPDLMVYPNPTSGLLTIDSDKDISEIEIYDFLGNKVNQITYEDSVIYLTDMPNGYYICRFLDRNNDIISIKEICLAN